MSMTDIEKKFIDENPDLLTAQRSVPDQMIHNDLIDAHFNTESLRESLRRSYQKRLTEAEMAQSKGNPKLSKEEVEKQAAAQAKQETKESKEAKLLQNRVAMIAEDDVQKSILQAMKEFNIPVFVFRGVNTYHEVGKHLGEAFGFKMSVLKAFTNGNSKSKKGKEGNEDKPGKKESTLECEHDISAIALPPSGPLVSFVQVRKLNLEGILMSTCR